MQQTDEGKGKDKGNEELRSEGSCERIEVHGWEQMDIEE